MHSFKTQFFGDVLAVVKMEGIPNELVLNWVPINIVPGLHWMKN